MATKTYPPMVSLFTDYEENSVRVLVAGKSGTLALSLHSEGPTISINDPERGRLRVKAVAELQANGHLKGFFIEKKGETPREDTMVFFPAQKQRKRPVKARKRKG